MNEDWSAMAMYTINKRLIWRCWMVNCAHRSFIIDVGLQVCCCPSADLTLKLERKKWMLSTPVDIIRVHIPVLQWKPQLLLISWRYSWFQHLQLQFLAWILLVALKMADEDETAILFNVWEGESPTNWLLASTGDGYEPKIVWQIRSGMEGIDEASLPNSQ